MILLLMTFITIVSSLTNIDDKFSLPRVGDYATQKGKTGETMANEFQECSGVPSMPKTRIRPAEYFEIEKHET